MITFMQVFRKNAYICYGCQPIVDKIVDSGVLEAVEDDDEDWDSGFDDLLNDDD